ncbi:DUF5714 domain-containing protein [Chloroflexota bacterium]
MESKNNCGICGKPLIYGTESLPGTCSFCGIEAQSNIYCPDGHYICDGCHQREAIDVLRRVVESTSSSDPQRIAETVMSYPAVLMHGPEHHAIVPAAIVAAVRNAGYPVPDNAVEKAIERGAKVPGGWCGFYGDCGAAVGLGIAVSVLTGATPLTGPQRSLAMKATAYALSKLIDEQPRCCKRMSRMAIEAAVEFLRDEMNISLYEDGPVFCNYSSRNKECLKAECAYYREPESEK